MQVILLERVEKLGQMGDVVEVKSGYGRNYLLPQGKALRANKANLARFESQKAQLEARNLEARGEAERVAQDLEGSSYIVIRSAGDGGQLYGSVTNRDAADLISEGGVSVDRRQVQIDKPIKELGLHQINVRLHPEVVVAVTLNVARSQEEAEIQAAGKSIAELRAEEEAAELAEMNAQFEGNAEFDVDALFEEGAGPDEDAEDDAAEDDADKDGEASKA